MKKGKIIFSNIKIKIIYIKEKKNYIEFKIKFHKSLSIIQSRVEDSFFNLLFRKKKKKLSEIKELKVDRNFQ